MSRSFVMIIVIMFGGFFIMPSAKRSYRLLAERGVGLVPRERRARWVLWKVAGFVVGPLLGVVILDVLSAAVDGRLLSLPDLVRFAVLLGIFSVASAALGWLVALIWFGGARSLGALRRRSQPV
jgi:hypothetical protein